MAGLQQQAWDLRSFPQGIRNCYNINIMQGTKYLIRGTFFYGNYDGLSKLPQFNLHLGVNKWDTVKIENVSVVVIKELIHVPSQNYLQVCLVNTGLGMPFISAIELRPLNNKTYVTISGSLALFSRYDLGSLSRTVYRYPVDVYDRIWYPYFDNEWTSLNTTLTIDSQSNNYYQPASIVMGTAVTPINVTAPLDMYWDSESATSEYYIYMHFAEVEHLKPNQSRSINITLNGNYWWSISSPLYLYTTTVCSQSALEIAQTYNFKLFKTEGSTLPPIINAIEIYSVRNHSQPGTNKQDVDAITNIKSTYELKRNWEGDPCLPQAYSWAGLHCSYDSINPPRIISLNLSAGGLTGVISADISNLMMLQYLDLSDNSLTGSIPKFLSQLEYLRVLNLERNQLTGSVPADLIERSNNGTLLLRVDENSSLCGSGSCKEKNNIVIPISVILLFIVVGLWLSCGGFGDIRNIRIKNKNLLTYVLIMLMMFAITTVETKSNIQTKSLESIDSMQRQFTYADLVRITNNFETVLGKGGSGQVYQGCIDDTQVAVKVLSLPSVQGYQQFQAEASNYVSILSTHRCKNTNILGWEARLNIAMEAAQGLEYLHNGCKPPIIHRDVKTTNILLNENFNAKLADFGLSKIFPTDGTHVSMLSVAGILGYLDPEYSISYRLTEKSDVYGFGVVLLEIITSRPAIERSYENTHISQWVRMMLDRGDIQNIVDPRLGGDFNVNSAWKAVEIAMACVSTTSSNRPPISEVVVRLKECLTSEIVIKRENFEGESNYSVDIVNMNMIKESNPLARA
ncbi:putative leucine-rich repeat receptor-like protein kinase [Quercus suber]|uniref:Leucine-rich repeat receptor-like protein kinase n=1 Tax=Quercus suber TaxID=58331 RepID=A0AAW0KYY9_QUESU